MNILNFSNNSTKTHFPFGKSILDLLKDWSLICVLQLLSFVYKIKVQVLNSGTLHRSFIVPAFCSVDESY